MLKINIKEKGFTIVELLIVIVVIGILAALVLNTFSGVQKRARDTQRQTDVSSLATQLEVYYNDNGGYPQFSQIDSLTKVQSLFKGIDAGAVQAPNGTTFDLQGTIATVGVLNKYGYQAFSDAAKTTACAANNACLNYTITWTKEDGTPAVQAKNSLN